MKNGRDIVGKIKLLLSFLGLNAYLGAVFGAVLGLVCYLIITQVSISIFVVHAVLLGLSVGCLIGGVNGLILGILTLFFFKNSTDKQKYQTVILVVSVFVCTVLTFASVYLTFEGVRPLEILLLNVVITLISAVGAAYGSQSISEWHLKLE
jgi:drug/metabolite transporter (DMT)-like permease